MLVGAVRSSVLEGVEEVVDIVAASYEIGRAHV